MDNITIDPDLENVCPEFYGALRKELSGRKIRAKIFFTPKNKLIEYRRHFKKNGEWIICLSHGAGIPEAIEHLPEDLDNVFEVNTEDFFETLSVLNLLEDFDLSVERTKIARTARKNSKVLLKIADQYLSEDHSHGLFSELVRLEEETLALDNPKEFIKKMNVLVRDWGWISKLQLRG